VSFKLGQRLPIRAISVCGQNSVNILEKLKRTTTDRRELSNAKHSHTTEALFGYIAC